MTDYKKYMSTNKAIKYVLVWMLFMIIITICIYFIINSKLSVIEYMLYVTIPTMIINVIGLIYIQIQTKPLRHIINNRLKRIQRIKVTPEIIESKFKTKSGKEVCFKAIRPKADVRIKQK